MKLLSLTALLAIGHISRTDARDLRDADKQSPNVIRRGKRPGVIAKVKGKIKASAKKEKDLTSIFFPGVSPEEYQVLEEITTVTGLVQSKQTQIPFNYYELPVCPSPNVTKKMSRRNIGSKLQGIVEAPAPYLISVLEDKSCTPLCMVSISNRKLKWLRSLVSRHYRIHLSLDGLPLLMTNSKMSYAIRGYPVGFKIPRDDGEDNFYLYNHLRFTVEHSTTNEGTIHITGFTVHPVSIKHGVEGNVIKFDTQIETCNKQRHSVVNDPKNFLSLVLNNDDKLDVVYSYEVFWVATEKKWTDRWDIYLIGSPEEKVHYFSIVNSFMVVLFLGCAVSVIMIRLLNKDIASYNDGSDDFIHEETGWKLVHADVFRPPKNTSMFLSICVGTGVQIGVAITITFASALAGILNPMNKGETLTSILILYVLSGSVAGYVSSRLYKFCEGKSWKRATFFTATGFPVLLVSMVLCLNIFLSYTRAATAVSLWTIISLFLFWICVATPLVFVGSYFGYRADKIETPTKTSQIARFIPERPWYVKTPTSYALSGLLPFGSVSIELLFIMAAIWLHQIYYAIGFLLFVMIILALTCVEVAVVMTYLQLSCEDHEWWWRSFLNTGATGAYLLVYSVWFLSSKLSLVGFLPVMVYFTYMSMISITVGLVCGAIGFLSSLSFNKYIYGALKIE